MLAALARDPLFMASAAPVLSQPAGIEIQRAPIREALRKLAGERMNDDTLDKVVRNVSSSWTQTDTAGQLKTSLPVQIRQHGLLPPKSPEKASQ